MPNGTSGSDSSIAENLPPLPNPGRGRSIAPFRIDASGDQNSAGKYPLISRPMQISTRVGVVQAMVAFPRYRNNRKLGRGGPVRKDRRRGPASFRQRSPKKNRTLAGPVAVCRRGGRQSPSRGEQLTALRLQSGRMGNRRPPVSAVCSGDFPTQRKGLHASHAATGQANGFAGFERPRMRAMRARNASAVLLRRESLGTPAPGPPF
jgi:hypothetical protein